jgi:hypothetical protein
MNGSVGTLPVAAAETVGQRQMVIRLLLILAGITFLRFESSSWFPVFKMAVRLALFLVVAIYLGDVALRKGVARIGPRMACYFALCALQFALGILRYATLPGAMGYEEITLTCKTVIDNIILSGLLLAAVSISDEGEMECRAAEQRMVGIILALFSGPVLVVLVLGLVQMPSVWSAPGSAQGFARLGGSAIHPNYVGAMGSMMLLIMAWDRTRLRLVRLLWAAIALAALLLSGSKTALLIGSATMGMILLGIHIRVMAFIPVLMVLVSSAYFWLFREAGVLSGREELWAIAIQRIAGWGPLDWLIGGAIRHPEEFVTWWGWTNASLHHLFLNSLYYSGLPLACFCLAWITRVGSEGSKFTGGVFAVLYLLPVMAGATEIGILEGFIPYNAMFILYCAMLDAVCRSRRPSGISSAAGARHASSGDI